MTEFTELITNQIKIKEEERARLNSLSTGDIIYCWLSEHWLYVKVGTNEINLYPIVEKGYSIEVRWQQDAAFTYGPKCQMWIKRKVIGKKLNHA